MYICISRHKRVIRMKKEKRLGTWKMMCVCTRERKSETSLLVISERILHFLNNLIYFQKTKIIYINS